MQRRLMRQTRPQHVPARRLAPHRQRRAQPAPQPQPREFGHGSASAGWQQFRPLGQPQEPGQPQRPGLLPPAQPALLPPMVQRLRRRAQRTAPGCASASARRQAQSRRSLGGQQPRRLPQRATQQRPDRLMQARRLYAGDASGPTLVKQRPRRTRRTQPSLPQRLVQRRRHPCAHGASASRRSESW